jgi:hypothetical protein
VSHQRITTTDARASREQIYKASILGANACIRKSINVRVKLGLLRILKLVMESMKHSNSSVSATYSFNCPHSHHRSQKLILE